MYAQAMHSSCEALIWALACMLEKEHPYYNRMLNLSIVLQSLRGSLESVERERQKAIRDLSATNQRVAVFAQGFYFNNF